MEYRGKESLPMIRMVLQVRWALEELGIEVPWNDAGPVCELVVPRGGNTIRIRREFSANAGRLIVNTVMMKLIAPAEWEIASAKLAALEAADGASPFCRLKGCLAFSEVIEVLPDDMTPMFMGKLLDRTTRRMLRVAESVGFIEKA